MDEKKVKKTYPADKRLKIFQLPVLGYFMFYLLISVGISIDSMIIDPLMPEGFEIGVIVASLLTLLFFFLYCLPCFRGLLSVKRLGKGLGMGAVIFGICIALNFISSLQAGLIDNGRDFAKALILSLTAGIGEEVLLRGPGLANFMRVTDDEKRVPVIFWVSSLFFGLSHLVNLIRGADLVVTLVQVVTAASAGMLFCAIVLRTGNLLPTIIIHTLIDLACFVNKTLLADHGIITTSITLIDWIYLAMSVPMAIVAIRLIAKKHRGEILAVWAERWKKQS